MNEPEGQQPEGREQEPRGKGGAFLRGCGIAAGVVALVFFFIVGACFIGFS